MNIHEERETTNVGFLLKITISKDSRKEKDTLILHTYLILEFSVYNGDSEN